MFRLLKHSSLYRQRSLLLPPTGLCDGWQAKSKQRERRRQRRRKLLKETEAEHFLVLWGAQCGFSRLGQQIINIWNTTKIHNCSLIFVVFSLKQKIYRKWSSEKRLQLPHMHVMCKVPQHCICVHVLSHFPPLAVSSDPPSSGYELVVWWFDLNRCSSTNTQTRPRVKRPCQTDPESGEAAWISFISRGFSAQITKALPRLFCKKPVKSTLIQTPWPWTSKCQGTFFRGLGPVEHIQRSGSRSPR